MRLKKAEAEDAWPIVLGSAAVQQDHRIALRLQTVSATLCRAVEVHCARRLHVSWSAAASRNSSGFCGWLGSSNGARFLASLEVDLSELTEEAALRQAASIGKALQQGVAQHNLQVASYHGHCMASSRSCILGPIASTLQQLSVVVGQPSWAGVCGGDSQAGLEDSGLQQVITAEDTEIQRVAAVLRRMQRLRSLRLLTVQGQLHTRLLATQLGALPQLTKLQLSAASLEDLQHLSCKQLQDLSVLSITASNSRAPPAAASPPHLAAAVHSWGPAAATGGTAGSAAPGPAASLQVSHLQALTRLHCPRGLVISAGDSLPASLQQLLCGRVASVGPLLALPRLQLLAADVSSLSADDLLRLASAAPQLSSLQLQYHNSNGGEGADGGELAAAAVAWPRLPVTELHLSGRGCCLSTGMLQQLACLGSSLTSLSIIACSGALPALSDDLAAALQQLRRLQQLTLQFTAEQAAQLLLAPGPAAVADRPLQLAQAISGLPCLTSVSLTSMPLSGAAARALASTANAPRITFAKFSQCELEDAGLSGILATWVALKALFVSGRIQSGSAAAAGTSKPITDAVLPGIFRLAGANLRTLMLTGTAISGEGEALLQEMPGLQSYVGP